MKKTLLERFLEKKLQKTNQIESRIEKVIKKKLGKLYVKWKSCDNRLIVVQIKRYSIRMSQYFPKL